jgi:Family of unknown function (DUF6152)
MKHNKLVMSVALIGALSFCSSVGAHHGQAVYDENNPIQLKGTVISFDWINPHCFVNLDVKDEKGNVVHWIAETVNPGKLARAGWTKDSLKPGDHVTLILTPARNGAHLGHFYKLTFADGRELTIGEECIHCPGNPNFESNPKQH